MANVLERSATSFKADDGSALPGEFLGLLEGPQPNQVTLVQTQAGQSYRVVDVDTGRVINPFKVERWGRTLRVLLDSGDAVFFDRYFDETQAQRTEFVIATGDAACPWVVIDSDMPQPSIDSAIVRDMEVLWLSDGSLGNTCQFAAWEPMTNSAAIGAGILGLSPLPVALSALGLGVLGASAAPVAAAQAPSGRGSISLDVEDADGVINAADAANGVRLWVALPTGAAIGDLITVKLNGVTVQTHAVTADDLKPGAGLDGKVGLLVPPSSIQAPEPSLVVISALYMTSEGTTSLGGEVSTSVTIDLVEPVSPRVTLAVDSGAISDDGITHDNAVRVSGLESGGTWTYSLDAGVTWVAGQGRGFELNDNTRYGVGDVQVRQTDAAGNTSQLGSNAQVWVEDSRVPTLTLGARSNTTIGVKSSEIGRAYLVESTQVVTSWDELEALPKDYWNSEAVTRPAAGPATFAYVPFGGLATASYVLYAADIAGNLSAVSSQQAITAPVLNLATRLMTGAINLGFQINGESAGDQAGVSVSGAGDVNGDGLDDLLIGSPGAANGNGRTYVVFGKTGTSVRAPDINLSDISDGNGGFVVQGSSGRGLGTSVAGVGDVNGDGLADMLVGAPDTDVGGSTAGRVYLVFGQSGGATVELSTVSNGVGGFAVVGWPGETSRSGVTVASAGDYNGDGWVDYLMTASDPSGVGSAYLVLGAQYQQDVQLSDVAAGVGGFELGEIGDQAGGISVASAGDFNGDGFADVVIGQPGVIRPSAVNGPTSEGSVSVRFGGLAGDNGRVEIKSAIGEVLGESVSGVGDINGDGYADIAVVASPMVGEALAPQGARSLYVVFGGSELQSLDASTVASGVGGFVIRGSDLVGATALSIASAGDMNGDGLDDLIVGECFVTTNGNAQAGNTYVVFGHASTNAVELSDVARGHGGFVLGGAAAGDLSGWSVSAAGDVNGDGLADVLIGAPGPIDGDAVPGSGKAYVIFGSATGGYYETQVDQMGTSGADSLKSAGGQTLIGGAGNDTLVSAGADVLSGGAGNDVLVLGAAMLHALAQGYSTTSETLARVNGGSGIDTLQVMDAGVLDLTAITHSAWGLPAGSAGRIQSIEAIDLGTDTASNTLKLSVSEVLAMSSANLFNTAQGPWTGSTLSAQVKQHQLKVDGGSNDVLVLVDAADWHWVGTDTMATVVYNIYEHDKEQAQLLVSELLVL